jgi:4-hydroxy-tetrahydrodipicolinate reductase
MGLAIARVAASTNGVKIVGAVDRPDAPGCGRDIGELAGVGAIGVSLSADLPAVLVGADVMVDFSAPTATARNLAAAAAAGVAALVGTTGLDAPRRNPPRPMRARCVPVIIAANTSLGVTLLIELVRAASRALPEDFDIEIIEGHHRHKERTVRYGTRTRPCGSRGSLGVARLGRGSRAYGPVSASAAEIGFAVVRGGDIVGDHTVLFAGEGERVSLVHQATDRAIFARARCGERRGCPDAHRVATKVRDVLPFKTRA